MKKTILFLGLLILLSSFAYAESTINQSLLMYYTLDGTLNSNDTSPYNGVWGNTGNSVTNCKVGGCYNFTSSSSHYYYANTAYAFGANPSMTECAWLYSYDYSAIHGILCFPSFEMCLETDASSQPFVRSWSVSQQILTCTLTLPTNKWFYFCAVYDGGNAYIYINGTQQCSGAHGVTADNQKFEVGRAYTSGTSYVYWNGLIDEIGVWTRALNAQNISALYNYGAGLSYPFFNYTPDTTPPTISKVNCTSCNPPNGSNQSPYMTYDTTPTFTLATNEAAACRIANTNLSYIAMNSSRDCDSGQYFLSNHTCTLKVFDELELTPTDYVYITCKDGYNNSNAIRLQMQLTYIQYNASLAIEKGIVSSIPSATIYSNQQVYVRTVTNSQALATFDKVAAYGSQRWAFSYIDQSQNETSIGTFYNLTPVFYFLEMINLTVPNIIYQVGTLINSTKT